MNQPPNCYLNVTGIQEIPENCSGLAACLNAAIAKIQDSYTPGETRIEVGDYIGIDLWAGCYVNGVVDHVPSKSSDFWIIINDDDYVNYVRYIYNPPAITLIRKGENRQ
jgi:hypothetical protein